MFLALTPVLFRHSEALRMRSEKFRIYTESIIHNAKYVEYVRAVCRLDVCPEFFGVSQDTEIKNNFQAYAIQCSAIY